MRTKWLQGVVCIVLNVISFTGRVVGFGYSDDEKIVFFPAYGYQTNDSWTIPIRLWVFEERSNVASWTEQLTRDWGDRTDEEMKNFRNRIKHFLADSESSETVTIRFDDDPAKEDFQVKKSNGDIPKTDWNGIVEGVLTISKERARELLAAQKSTNGWLQFQATSPDHSGTGRLQLIEPEGLSVISDVDDTIKVTGIPAGKGVVIENSLFKAYQAVPGMADRYQQWKNTSFHYVSGSPWQLYEPLSDFLFAKEQGFPEGTFHLKNSRKNLFSSDTWRDLSELLTNGNATYDQKSAQIKAIMSAFPKRSFILVGDTGEKDPELYRAIQTAFPNQVKEIWIRDVTNDRELNPGRLKGLNVIPAETIVREKID
jgi:phosphatidate phosphatase APP1